MPRFSFSALCTGATVAALLVSSLASAGMMPPLNDTCSSALSAAAGPTPYDLTGATLDPGAPPPTDADMINDVWFVYVAGCTGTATIETCEGSSGADTTLEVYDGGTCPPTLSLGDADDSGCGISGFSSRLTIAVTSGNSYLVRIGGWNGGEPAGILDITCSPSGPPANDDCANAQMLGLGTAAFSTINATTDGLPGSGCQFDGQVYNDIWFEYVHIGPAAEVLTVSTCGIAGYDTDLALYDNNGPAPCPPTDTELLACNDDFTGCPGFTSEVSTVVQAGDSVLIRVGGWDAASFGTGNVELTLTPVPPPFVCPPGAIEESALIGSPACQPNGFDSDLDENGGCNSSPPSFTSILCGETICGEAGTYVDATGPTFRDTDWYVFNVPAGGGTYTLTASARQSKLFGIMDLQNCVGQFFVDSFVHPGGDSVQSVTVVLTEGEYAAFAGSDIFGGRPCDGDDDNRYWLRLSCVPSLTMTSPDLCYDQSENTVTVDITLANLEDPIVGVQVFLQYDQAVLEFASADPGDAPFDHEIFESVDEDFGRIIYATGQPLSNPGTTSDTRVATITFTILDELCPVPATLVSFLSGPAPSTYVTNAGGDLIVAELNDLSPLQIDQTPPVIFCPGDILIECDESSLPANTGTATATDNCTASPLLSFTDATALGDCNGTGTITRTWTATDTCGNAVTCDQIITVVDTTPPALTFCPPDTAVPADAGGCTAVVTWTAPAATDNCGASFLFSQSHASGDTFNPGVTTVTFIFSDNCGNQTVCDFDVEVLPTSVLELSVNLFDVYSTVFDRCVVIELSGTDSATVSQVVTFVSGNGGTVSIDVPCGDYDCALVRDPLHTLGSAVAVVPSGTVYTVTATGGDGLIGGNLNDDPFIDILDFGLFVGQYAGLLPVNTDCNTLPPHSDFSGNGAVFTEDFAFIQVHFLNVADSGCGLAPAGGAVYAGSPQLSNHAAGPLRRISVEELRRRGLGDLARADFNQDGWLDERDIARFLEGDRP